VFAHPLESAAHEGTSATKATRRRRRGRGGRGRMDETSLLPPVW